MAKKFRLNNLNGFLISEFAAHVKDIADGDDPIKNTEYRDWYESHCELLRSLDACDNHNESLANTALPAR